MVDLRQARNTDGWLLFAAVIMFIVGFHNLIYGIAALRDYVVVVDNLYSTSTGTGVIYASTSFWGWLWIAFGVVQMVIAAGIAAGNELARWVGIGIAALNAIGQLAFLAAFPVWSVIIIAIDILVIYALATYQTRGRPGGAVEPYPGDRPGVARGASTRSRTGAYAGSTTGPGGGGMRAGGDASGAGRSADSGDDFFEPTSDRPGAAGNRPGGRDRAVGNTGGTGDDRGAGMAGNAGGRFPTGTTDPSAGTRRPESGYRSAPGGMGGTGPDSGSGRWSNERPPPTDR
ncbi:DUF7144 family membrane protein [Parafrankia elaeagni]|uniref:DUF7144 family membrane protein n=1 Tax=Parafrankia elaeagni TaxID=222534 RepID=UPI00037C692E|nr:hypothetical protein [Parafrankia elaeagni]